MWQQLEKESPIEPRNLRVLQDILTPPFEPHFGIITNMIAERLSHHHWQTCALLHLTTRCRSRVRRKSGVLGSCFRSERVSLLTQTRRQVLQSRLQLLHSASDARNVLGRDRPAHSHAALTGGSPAPYIWGGAFILPTPSPLRGTNGDDPRLTGFLLLQGVCRRLRRRIWPFTDPNSPCMDAPWPRLCAGCSSWMIPIHSTAPISPSPPDHLCTPSGKIFRWSTK